MGEIFKWAIIIIIAFAVFGYLIGKDGDREDSAKIGAVVGASFILELLPIVLVVFFVVLLVKACT